jgi:serine/threonine protein kinase
MPVGTEHFRAPELCGRPGVNRKWDEQADIFAVGLIAYRMVTRFNAFDMRHPFEKGEFRPHPKIDADIGFKNLLTGLLQIKPQKRPSAAQALTHEALAAARKQIVMECQKAARETSSGDEGEVVSASRAKSGVSSPRSVHVSFLN